MRPSINSSGFTLIEILVSLLLITFIFSIITVGNDSNRRRLDKILNGLERAVRFSVDEAALKNTLVRVKVKTEGDIPTYTVQFSTDKDFSIKKEELISPTSEDEAETYLAKKKKRDSNFSSIVEFSEGDREFPDGVFFLGMGMGLSQTFETENDPSFYIYPTGEKDSVIIVLGTDEELATLEINPFTLEIKRSYYPFKKNDSDELDIFLKDKAEGLYQEWAK